MKSTLRSHECVGGISWMMTWMILIKFSDLLCQHMWSWSVNWRSEQCHPSTCHQLSGKLHNIICESTFLWIFLNNTSFIMDHTLLFYQCSWFTNWYFWLSIVRCSKTVKRVSVTFAMLQFERLISNSQWLMSLVLPTKSFSLIFTNCGLKETVHLPQHVILSEIAVL